MRKAVKLTNKSVQPVKKDNPAKQSGVPPVKSAMQINLKSHAKIALTKGQLAKHVQRKQMLSRDRIFPLILSLAPC